MRRALIAVGALIAGVAPLERAWATQVCAWIDESIDTDGDHKFALELSADAPAEVSVRFQGPNFTSAAMGGDLIALTPGEPNNVETDGLDIGALDEVAFDVRLYAQPLASLDEMEHPTAKPFASFVFHRKVGQDEHKAPADLAAKQCQPLG